MNTPWLEIYSSCPSVAFQSKPDHTSPRNVTSRCSPLKHVILKCQEVSVPKLIRSWWVDARHSTAPILGYLVIMAFVPATKSPWYCSLPLSVVSALLVVVYSVILCPSLCRLCRPQCLSPSPHSPWPRFFRLLFIRGQCFIFWYNIYHWCCFYQPDLHALIVVHSHPTPLSSLTPLYSLAAVVWLSFIPGWCCIFVGILFYH